MESIRKTSVAKKCTVIGAYILILLLEFVPKSWSQTKKRRIKIIDENCKNINSDCECHINKFSCDSNIYIQQLKGEYRTSISDANMPCFAVDLWMYGSKIRLDSTYYANINNKDMLYIGGLIEGTYQKINGIIVLRLKFANLAINTSATTEHVFTVKYSIAKKRTTELKLHFLNN